jgi:acyl carrier protein
MGSQRITDLMVQVFGVDATDLSEQSSPDTIEEWDSMSHINLILALEREFQVKFTAEESVEMLSVKLVELTLSEKGVDLA